MRVTVTHMKTRETLKSLGDRRRALIAEQRDIEAQMRPLLKAAREERLSLRDLEEVSGLSVQTIRIWAA